MEFANKFGYLLLRRRSKGSDILIKTNHIQTMHAIDEGGSKIYVNGNLYIDVCEELIDILAQIENIHPNMR